MEKLEVPDPNLIGWGIPWKWEELLERMELLPHPEQHLGVIPYWVWRTRRIVQTESKTETVLKSQYLDWFVWRHFYIEHSFLIHSTLSFSLILSLSLFPPSLPMLPHPWVCMYVCTCTHLHEVECLSLLTLTFLYLSNQSLSLNLKLMIGMTHLLVSFRDLTASTLTRGWDYSHVLYF